MNFRLLSSLVLLALAASSAQASWVFNPSYFSHDPASGERAIQYAPGIAPPAPYAPDYRQGAYRHKQTVLRKADGSVDRRHVVETWGGGEYIRPYGEWERPFREGATPFGPWGNPQGPWTTPFGSWVNPYGLGQLPHPPWPHYGYPVPYPVPPAPLATP
ncbi:MAG: hypothetical protein KJZ87_05735 [Thermoguttaceae bacterium]|nr:hypothetical protein [Thermoguttaceae bacterium]